VNRRRQILIALGSGALIAPYASLAQQNNKIRRIGFLVAAARPPSIDAHYMGAFVRGLRDLGYVEGKNFAIEWRFADGNYQRLPVLAAELVSMNVDVLMTGGTAANSALQKATTTIPIVNATMSDPVGNGFAKSLTHPGGNITGLALATTDMSPKHVELLRLIVPKLTSLGLLVNLGNSAHPAVAKSITTNAQRLGIKVRVLDARNADGLTRNFSIMKQERTEAVIAVVDAFFISQRREIAELALKNNLPSMFSAQEHVEAGGLMSYGQNLADLYRRAAAYVDKIFKGAKPGNLPIEQPAVFSLAINSKTAKALGLEIPQELLLRADKVIE
jgi:putative ABC transport system substrate-binding protein